MPRVHVGDIDIYYERRTPAADAPHLLFISGTGGDLRREPSAFSFLPGEFDILAYDQRGLGQTSQPDTPYTMANYANDAAGLLDAVDWPEANVLGISFGGMVALEFAIRHPHRVRRLALCCTSPGGAGGASYPLHTLQHLRGAELARKMIALSDVRRDEAWMRDHPKEAERLLALYAGFMGEDGLSAGGHRQLEARAHHDTWDRLGRIIAPTLICAGRYDGIARPEVQAPMAERIPTSRLEFFDGGHAFFLENPEAMPVIAAFLKE